MVATRRMAPRGPEIEHALDQGPELALKKKPVRKATAKTAQTEAKPKSTRSKKAAPGPEMEINEPGQEIKASKTTKKSTIRGRKDIIELKPGEEELVEPAKETRSTKAGSVRGRKAVGTAPERQIEPAIEDARPSGTTKAGSTRGRKAALTVAQDPAPEVEETKPSQATKGGSVRGRKVATGAVKAPSLPAPEPKTTRQTRTAATKAQPLSPKKITQVSKPATRNTENAKQKIETKPAAKKAPLKGKSKARTETVSDENAGVTTADPPAEEEVNEVIMVSTSPMKSRTTRNKVHKRRQTESEATVSSRPPTPEHSVEQSLSQAQEEHEFEQEAISNVTGDLDASDDELCGPKTPMKRASPGAEARYHASAQRTIRKYEDENRKQTPARRFHVLGSQRGTPQTQKPYCKPAPPSSDVRPMTVARGTGRAFVFKDLRDSAPSLDENVPMESEEDEPSFIPDEDIIPTNEEVTAIPTPTTARPVQLQSPPESIDDAEEDDDAAFQPSNSVEDEERFINPSLVEQDPEETVLIDSMDDRADSLTTHPAESFETEDTVIISRLEQQAEDEDMFEGEQESDEDSVVMHESVETETPQKLGWGSHTHATPIAVNFADHLADVRSPSKQEWNELSLNEGPQETAQKAENQAVAGAEMKVDFEPAFLEQPTRRESMNLSDSIDVAALSEPTIVLEASPTSPQIDHGSEMIIDAFVEELHQIDEDARSTPGPEQTGATLDMDVEDAFAEPAAQQEESFDESEADQEPHAGTAKGEEMEPQVPHYALPTIAFDARRKSLPVLSFATPAKINTRPNTSDGASMPRMANPFTSAWWARSRANSTATTPVKSRPSTTHGASNAKSTPKKVQGMEAPKATPMERFPRLAPRQDYGEHARTVAAPVRFATPSEKSPRRRETFHKAIAGQVKPKVTTSASEVPSAVNTPQATPSERYPRMKPRVNYEEHAQTVVAPKRFSTPSKMSPKRRETLHKVMPGQARTQVAVTTPIVPTAAVTPQETPQATPSERYPRLGARQNYEEHAKTVAAPRRFHTPTKTPLKRPATTQKPDSLRKAAIKANTPLVSHTPMKTPLRAPAMTPSQEPMTPHPAAPLRGVVALVEVFTLEGASASAPFVALLHRLDAKTARTWSDRVTHVIFKDGSPTTLQRVRLHNKDVDEKGTGAHVYCVNSRWVNDCDTEGTRMDESDEAYIVDIDEVPRGGKRRRKSMEPSALMNVGGNIVRDRKSSIGRRVSSIGRSPLKFDSPVNQADIVMAETPKADIAEKENSGDEQGSPATPTWIAAPGQLVQQTAPMNRFRKLDLQDKKEAKNRRLTFWNGGS